MFTMGNLRFYWTLKELKQDSAEKGVFYDQFEKNDFSGCEERHLALYWLCLRIWADRGTAIYIEVLSSSVLTDKPELYRPTIKILLSRTEFKLHLSNFFFENRTFDVNSNQQFRVWSKWILSSPV